MISELTFVSTGLFSFFSNSFMKLYSSLKFQRLQSLKPKDNRGLCVTRSKEETNLVQWVYGDE